MNIFNWSINKKAPNQREIVFKGNMIGGYFGSGYDVVDFDLYSQVKGYRTDLLNGTNWRATNPALDASFSYLQFIRLISKYSTAIFNDWLKVGFAVFAIIDEKVFYFPRNQYTVSGYKVKVNGYPNATVYTFDEPNAFNGELTVFKKCEQYQNLYNIALSCQKNGMSKSGFVNVISPRTPRGANTVLKLTDREIQEMEKTLSENHGVSNSEQNNMLILKQEVDISTMVFDFAKLGILETKKLCEEFVCSQLGVPFVLLPSSGQTFNNYEQANTILYENHSKYCEYFCKFTKDYLGFDIDYETIAEADKGITV